MATGSTAIISRVGATVDAIDVFCGFGGSSQGIHAAGADLLAAANHKQLAIECHAANFPHVDHWRADLVDPDSGDYMDAADLPQARFAWFSPGCQHHSPANAVKLYERGRQASLFDEMDDFDYAAYARSERSRVTMSCVLRYVAARKPELLVVENVVEVTNWGPDRDGTTFAWWKRSLENLGYEIECCFFNSQFFPPCPQSRDRIYIVAWRKGNTRPDLDYRPAAYCASEKCGGRHVEAIQSWKAPTKKWPLKKWGKYGVNRQYIYRCPDCNAPVEPAAWPAYTAIDWSNLGPALHERAAYGLDPLADKTVERIRRALAKFHGFPKLVIPAKSVWGIDRPTILPFTAQTTQQEKALLTSALVPQRNNVPKSMLEQINSLTAHGDQSLVSVALPAAGNTYEKGDYQRARHISSTLHTQHTTQAFGVASMPSVVEMRGGGSVKSGQHPVTSPIQTVTASARHHYLMSPGLFAKFNGEPNSTAWHQAGDPLNTVTTADTHGLVMLPWFGQYQTDPVGVTQQLAELMAEISRTMDAMQPLPLEAISEDDLMQARFRMLEPQPELRRAMAFADDYILLGNKTEMTAGLGNAVTPPVAAWITERCLATLRGTVA